MTSYVQEDLPLDKSNIFIVTIPCSPLGLLRNCCHQLCVISSVIPRKDSKLTARNASCSLHPNKAVLVEESRQCGGAFPILHHMLRDPCPRIHPLRGQDSYPMRISHYKLLSFSTPTMHVLLILEKRSCSPYRCAE